MGHIVTPASLYLARRAADMGRSVRVPVVRGVIRMLSPLAAHLALEGQRTDRLWCRLVDEQGLEVMDTLGPWLQQTWGRGYLARSILRAT